MKHVTDLNIVLCIDYFVYCCTCFLFCFFLADMWLGEAKILLLGKRFFFFAMSFSMPSSGKDHNSWRYFLYDRQGLLYDDSTELLSFWYLSTQRRLSMGKDKPGFLTPKAIANRIKAKGLQKLRWYCQMCQKQCRDEVICYCVTFVLSSSS